jgi:MFS family permease
MILPVYLPTMLISFSFGMLIPVLPLFVRGMEESYGWIGLTLAASGMGTLIAAVPSGLVLRRMGYRKGMLIGGVLVVLSGVALSWSQSLLEVAICRFLTGIGASLLQVARHAYLAEIAPVQRRGRFLATLGGVARIGICLGPFISGRIAGAWGLRATFSLFGVMGVAAIVAMMLFLPMPRARKKKADGEPTNATSLFQVIRANFRNLFTAGAGQVCGQLVRTSRYTILPLYAADVLGMGVESVSLIITIAAGADVAMFHPAGVIMDRWGRKYATGPCFLTLGVGMALIPLSSGFVSLMLVSILIGAGNGIGSGTMMTLAADLAPEENRSEFLGVWQMIGYSGGMGGPMVVGGLGDLLGLEWAAVAVGGVGVIGAAIFTLAVPETLSRKARN